MKHFFGFLLIFISTISNAQNMNSKWCFGDSAGIDFTNLSQPVPFHSAVKSRGSCVSISNKNGDLLFYAYTYTKYGYFNTKVINHSDSVMINGDSILGEAWYKELLIIPFPNDTNMFYLFSIGTFPLGQPGLFYSIIDMKLNNGNGEVISKNNQLLSYPACDGLTAVKHGNGRDWWLLYRKIGYAVGWYDNRFYKFLVSAGGIALADSQDIGSLAYQQITNYSFSKNGDKLGCIDWSGLVEVFDFDRCSGLLSNHILIHPQSTQLPFPEYVSCEFSQGNRFLYVSTATGTTITNSDSIFVIQVDLQNPQLFNAADTICILTNTSSIGGILKRGPDDKIYFSCAWYDGINFNFPYPDSVYNMYNTHLSVINQPDSLGSACDFQPFSFYLGGSRTYWGLPNNPDYELPKITGSICDSLQFTGLTNPLTHRVGSATLQTTYISEWQKLFVNAQNIKGKNCVLKLFDVNGREVFSSSKKTQPPYFTQDVDVGNLASGIYLVNLITEKETLSAKFVKEN